MFRYDDVFKPAQAILDSLNGATESLNSVNANIVKAEGLGEGDSVADAIAKMKEEAKGKFKVEMKDMKPIVTVADDAGDNVKAAVAAINDGGKAMVDAIKTSRASPTRPRKSLQPRKFPPRLPQPQGRGLSVKEMGGAPKTVKNNAARWRHPRCSQGHLEAAKGNIDLIKGLAG